MTNTLFSQWFGWAGLILLIIPLVLLVRILVKKSRWSILRMTIVSVTGVFIVSLWLHFAETITGAVPLSMSGKLGFWLSDKLQGWWKRRSRETLGSDLCLTPDNFLFLTL